MQITSNKIKDLMRNPFRIFIWALTKLPYFSFIHDTQEANDRISFGRWYKQKVLGYNSEAYWPTHFTSRILGAHNILVGVGTNPGFIPGCYIQGSGKLYFGDHVTMGQNSGILSGGHDIYEHKIQRASVTRIGSYCWIGMNCSILAGIELGENTIVGAGSVVTKSFPEGNCIIAGNPAKLIRKLDPSKLVKIKYKHEYHGYIRKEKFEEYRKKNLNI
jgi:acetyltransferase-like isoleucine patch superfamily enzyme